MTYSVVRTAAADADFETILDHLIRSHVNMGASVREAIDQASDRIRRIQKSMEALDIAPFQGTRRDYLLRGLRSVTKGKAIFHFTVDEEHRKIFVLAVFYSGQDHLTQIIAQLKSEQG